ncbi:hypothetical protein [Paenibacillus sp. BJ-4]|uniref:hypothetical protein n=1 Tax=Paenibacillus sp. BJ-4 TaxID=2878097 RepID=UPI001CF0080E|nr:hypothetical protein [Paenibacillus sp. BJ-4]
MNGSEQRVKSQNAFLNLIDFPIQLTHKAVNVVVIGNKADLAVDGVYIGTNQPYVPVGKVLTSNHESQSCKLLYCLFHHQRGTNCFWNCRELLD